MGDRLNKIHADVLSLADPDNPSNWTQFWRKIGKTVHAVYDHKKGAAAAWTIGVAASIGLGIATGGASLLIQFAIGTAYALTKTAGGKVMDYAYYKMDKKKLEDMKNMDPAKIGRGNLRTVKNSLAYNEEHLKTSIYKATQAFLKLSGYKSAADSIRGASSATVDQTSIQTLSAKQAEDLLASMYHFYFEYDRALHYFAQYEVFVEYSHAFVAAQGEWYNGKVGDWDRAIARTVDESRTWHTENCRKSILKTDICYGMKETNLPDRSGCDQGTPHHRVIQ